MTKNLGLKLEKFNTHFFNQFDKIFDAPAPYKNYNGKLVKPEPYIWHLSPKKNRLGIHKNGILAKSNDRFGYGPAVFANNFLELDGRLYDFNGASDFYQYDKALNYKQKSKYTDLNHYLDFLEADFWRIETSKLPNHKWWVDTMWSSEYGNIYTNDHIYTNKSIPRKAITLFNVNTYSKFILRKGTLGVYHSKYISEVHEIKRF